MAAEADIGSQQEEKAEQKADEAYDSLEKSASKGIDTTKNRLGKMSVSSDIGSKAVRGILQVFYKMYQAVKSVAGFYTNSNLPVTKMSNCPYETSSTKDYYKHFSNY